MLATCCWCLSSLQCKADGRIDEPEDYALAVLKFNGGCNCEPLKKEISVEDIQRMLDTNINLIRSLNEKAHS